MVGIKNVEVYYKGLNSYEIKDATYSILIYIIILFKYTLNKNG